MGLRASLKLRWWDDHEERRWYDFQALLLHAHLWKTETDITAALKEKVLLRLLSRMLAQVEPTPGAGSRDVSST
jgi:hypothetical protein